MIVKNLKGELDAKNQKIESQEESLLEYHNANGVLTQKISELENSTIKYLYR